VRTSGSKIKPIILLKQQNPGFKGFWFLYSHIAIAFMAHIAAESTSSA